MSQEHLNQLALTLTPGIGNILVKHLISYCGSAQQVYASTANQLNKIPGISLQQARTIIEKQSFTAAEEIMSNLAPQEISLHSYFDPEYPFHLKKIHDAPVIIYSKGQANLNNPKIVSIVGTRQATTYGREVVEEIIAGLQQHQPLILSGLAYGIDIHAHQTALKYKLPTVAVLAGGLDRIYPHLHKPTVKEMLQKDGGIISEYALGIKPDMHHFPSRNRIIAGMADVVIIVEAAERGGALITANLANGYNKDIFAVPGNIDHSFSKGCNALIKDHKAHIYTNATALMEFMNWDLKQKSKKQERKDFVSQCTNEEIKIIQNLSDHVNGLHIDSLSIISQYSINKVACLLLQLEFKGIVKALPGKKFRLVI